MNVNVTTIKALALCGCLFVALCSPLYATGDLFITKSAKLPSANAVGLRFDATRYARMKEIIVERYEVDAFGETNYLFSDAPVRLTMYEFYHMPVNAYYSFTSFMMLDLALPLVGYRNSAQERKNAFDDVQNKGTFQLGVGDPTIGVRVMFDDPVKRSWNAFGAHILFPMGMTKTRMAGEIADPYTYRAITASSAFDAKTEIVDEDYTYYPFLKGLGEFRLSYYATREWIPRLLSHFNFSYVYELAEGETFWEFESPFGDSDTGEGFNISKIGFGLEKLFKKLFWIWSKTDPWAYRFNDHIEINTAVEYSFRAPLTMGRFTLPMAYRFFIEANGVVAFGQASSRRTEIAITPGVFVTFFDRLSYLFAYSFIVYDQPNRFYTHRMGMSLSYWF